MDLSSLIKTYRKNKKMTQKELAAKAGLSEVAIRKYEKGDRTPSNGTLILLASVLGISPTELLKVGRSVGEFIVENQELIQGCIKFADIGELFCKYDEDPDDPHHSNKILMIFMLLNCEIIKFDEFIEMNLDDAGAVFELASSIVNDNDFKTILRYLVYKHSKK